MRIAITGATGLVGRNLLLELIKQNLNDLQQLEIILFGKGKGSQTFQVRIEAILLSEGPDYISDDRVTPELLHHFCQDNLKFVELNLGDESLGITDSDLKILKQYPIDFFFHSAGITDFRDGADAVKRLRAINFTGTHYLTELAAQLQIGEFCYVGTAYACGNIAGDVEPDFSNINQGFRNPYEQIKLEAELVVQEFQQKTGIRCRYFRPSTISGRLLEKELGATPKFDVFYLWAAFFLRWKMKMVGNDMTQLYETPVEMACRYWGNRQAGLNIVPVDFVVKGMVEICMQNAPGDSFHLANSQETPHELYTAVILDALNINGPQFVDKMPKNLNRLESFYYKTVGKLFMPYAIQEPINFLPTNTTHIFNNADLTCPAVDENDLYILLDYAKKQLFGLEPNGVLE
jgi:nucleoside-diphosphate-sugar epimerase